MAILQLKSSNPKFSYVIRKNPESGMQIKSVRKGKAFGWYSDPSVYNVYFKDAENEISYQRSKDENYEYLNVARYNSPLFPLGAITDFFSYATKNMAEEDASGFESVFFANMVGVEHAKYLEYFQKHFAADYRLAFEEIAHKNYKIEISTCKTVHELLHLASVLFLFLSLMSEQYVEIDDSVIAKYVRSINAIDAPFYIRYLFARNVLTSRKKFEQYKEMIENSKTSKIELAFGNTASQRQDWISSKLGFGKPIVDIGCGEGAYAIPFSKKIGDRLYHAIDVDENARRKVQQKSQLKEIENIALYESLVHFLESYENETVDVILTEVVEHMEMEEAKTFVREIAKKINFDKLIITTPNAAFNTHYAIDHFRHHDHKWEMTDAEYQTWINEVFDGQDVEIIHAGIGDNVDGITTTQGAVIARKGR